MKRPFTLYLDESGSRHPDKKPDPSRQGRDWFGLGGVLIRGDDHDAVKSGVNGFVERWKVRGPLHFTDMHSRKSHFSWLGRLSQKEFERFMGEWRDTLCEIPVIGVGCVVDKPGYVARGYLKSHTDRWLLCRSAFDITVERAVKIARHEGRKLHVVFEQDTAINQTMTQYFENLKSNGLAFNSNNSAKYQPLSQFDFQDTLGRISHKPKSHIFLQVADSYIYAMCRGSYEKRYWLFKSLCENRKMSDQLIPNQLAAQVGIKRYCFDPKTTKPGFPLASVAAPIR